MILPINPHTIINQPVFSSIITEVKPVLNDVKKLPLSAKIKHIVEAKTKASKIRFVVKIYITRKIAGINAKNPIDWPSAIELDEGKKAVNKNVKPIKRIQVIQKPKILFLKLCCPSLPINGFLQISI
jgi:hypothetical protein